MENHSLTQLVETFNSGRYRECVEPFEALYFPRRQAGYKGLIQLAVALLQLDLGLTSGPVRLLEGSRRLLSDSGGADLPTLDIPSLIEQIRDMEAWLAAGKTGARPIVQLRLL